MREFYFRNIGMGADSFEILKKSAKRFLNLRDYDLSEIENDSYVIEVSKNSSLENGEYKIIPTETGVEIEAECDCDIHAAFGHLLAELDLRENKEVKPLKEAISHKAKKKIRGMYFAFHGGNFYHSAPLEEIYEVVEDLALRGCNNILAWFDMNYYSSMDDEVAKNQADRIKSVFEHSNKLGISTSLLMLGNEAFRRPAPEELRAQYHVQGNYIIKPGGHYHIEICPSVEGGMEEILKQRREVLEYFKDVNVDYIVYWPYDQGGCTCKDCEPWGANGFMKILPHFKKLVGEYYPKCEVIVSTWYFDKFIDHEWDMFYEKMLKDEIAGTKTIMSFFPAKEPEKPKGAKRIESPYDKLLKRGKIPEFIRDNKIPEGIRFIDFPEISMYRCHPWGGFGAVLTSEFLENSNNETGYIYDGGFPYSEGIFEDANKFLVLTSFYQGRYTTADDAIRAYCKLEFCCDDEDLYDAVKKSQYSIPRLAHMLDEPGKEGCMQYEFENTEYIDYVYEVISKYNELLPKKITQNYKFRLFYLRSVIDYEMLHNDFYAEKSERCLKAMEEVDSIYFANKKTASDFRTPRRDFMKGE